MQGWHRHRRMHAHTHAYMHTCMHAYIHTYLRAYRHTIPCQTTPQSTIITRQNNITQHTTIKYSALQYKIMQCSAMQCNVMRMQCNAMQSKTTRCHTTTQNHTNRHAYLHQYKHKAVVSITMHARSAIDIYQHFAKTIRDQLGLIALGPGLWRISIRCDKQREHGSWLPQHPKGQERTTQHCLTTCRRQRGLLPSYPSRVYRTEPACPRSCC